MIQAKVARILSPTRVILSAGSQEGVREGTVFVIYQLGDPIIDPETHESLGQLEHIKGRVKVYHVQEKLCHASTLSRTETRVLDPWEALQAFRPRKIEETVFEQLKVDKRGRRANRFDGACRRQGTQHRMIYLVWGTKPAEIVVKRGQAHPDIPAGVIVAWGIKSSRRHAQILKYEIL